MSSKINKVKETESDIEQKIIYPFLTKKSVDGLGINKEYILTKRNIKSLEGNDSNLLIVFYVQIMPDDLVMQLHRF